jgi:hypothetical protein
MKGCAAHRRGDRPDAFIIGKWGRDRYLHHASISAKELANRAMPNLFCGILRLDAEQSKIKVITM